MTIRHTVDEIHRTLIIELSGTISGHAFSTFACDLYGRRPELFDYECVVDLLEYEGDVGFADLGPLEKIYTGRPEGTAAFRPGFIVTSDPNIHLWAAVLDEQFPGRKHYVAASLEEAFSR